MPAESGIYFMLGQMLNDLHAQAPLLIVTSLLLIGLILLRARLRRDVADHNFRSQGLRVSQNQVNLHRQELIDLAAKLGRDIFKTDASYQIRARQMLKEHERIRQSISESPLVIKEVGIALQKIEEEYERGKTRLKSPQAREALRLAAARVINDVMASCKDGGQSAPSFWLDSEYEYSRNGVGKEDIKH